MPAVLRVVTEQDLLDYVSGRLDEEGSEAVSQLMREDYQVRNLVSQFSHPAQPQRHQQDMTAAKAST